MAKYRLVIPIEIEAPDDPEARKIARLALSKVSHEVDLSEAKLQRVYGGRPPEGVRLK